MRGSIAALLTALLTSTATLSGAPFFNYVGQLDSRSALLAWGETAAFGNSIGRDSKPLGKAVIRIGDHAIPSDRNWVLVEGLQPDSTYSYEVEIDGRKRGAGRFRTWPDKSTHFCFFSIGDYGTGASAEYRVADAMWREFQRRDQTGCPVRFIITVGDNIYADLRAGITAIHSGDLDAHWESKFFRPFQELIAQAPFMPALGNHDGNGSENRGDLTTYLDNFFFPGNVPARWYTFTFGGFAQFFALDSTNSTLHGPPRPAWQPGGDEDRWLHESLGSSTAAWKIPYLHHPMFNAGPMHPAYHDSFKEWVDLFEKTGVKVVISGHEHNLQVSKPDETGGILYVVSGSGGQLDPQNVRSKMSAAHIQAWAPQHEFLSIEIDGSEMRITPVSPDELRIVTPDNRPVRPPITQTLK